MRLDQHAAEAPSGNQALLLNNERRHPVNKDRASWVRARVSDCGMAVAGAARGSARLLLALQPTTGEQPAEGKSV
ncbi:hypothetical protein GobsT_22580 [Gemmata obscuriglobus]|nr:hypothetical protein GobsT_22580 [Gemmata obscuriglobus]VTS04523.1 unnamed protein product [Gemmata obscuriglobus UQM 2246]